MDSAMCGDLGSIRQTREQGLQQISMVLVVSEPGAPLLPAINALSIQPRLQHR
jgi:hypothetical protein